MKTLAAWIERPGQDFEVAEFDLDDPHPGEVLVRLAYAGLCHSDHHIKYGMGTFPMVVGHEGSGVIEQVGAGVVGLQPGDHVLTSFLPVCGTCRWCIAGRVVPVRSRRQRHDGDDDGRQLPLPPGRQGYRRRVLPRHVLAVDDRQSGLGREDPR